MWLEISKLIDGFEMNDVDLKCDLHCTTDNNINKYDTNAKYDLYQSLSTNN